MTVRVERDRWGPGPSILDPSVLESLRAALAIAPLIVEHWYYRGGRGPKPGGQCIRPMPSPAIAYL